MNNADYLPDELTTILFYDSVAEWCSKRGIQGKVGDRLPNLLSTDVLKLINDDPEAFEKRVRQCAYALAMNLERQVNHATDAVVDAKTV